MDIPTAVMLAEPSRSLVHGPLQMAALESFQNHVVRFSVIVEVKDHCHTTERGDEIGSVLVTDEGSRVMHRLEQAGKPASQISVCVIACVL